MPDAVGESELPFVARDGLPLVGTLFSAAGGDGPASLPAVVAVHGFGGSRTGNIRSWGRELARRGFPAFVIGNRGSDRSWTHEGRRYGGAHEWLDEAPRDLRGAVDALRRRGHERFILAGQSLGCVKVTYTQAVSPIEGVVGVVARAGPRFAPSARAERAGAPRRGVRRGHARRRGAGRRRRPGGPDRDDRAGAGAVRGRGVPGEVRPARPLRLAGPDRAGPGPVADHPGGSDPSLLVQAAIEAVRNWEETPPGCEAHVVPHWQHGLELPGEDVPAASAQLVADWWARVGAGEAARRG